MMFTSEGRAELVRLVASGRAELEALVAKQARITEQINEKRVRIDVLEELLRDSRPERSRSGGTRQSGAAAGLKDGSRVAKVLAYLVDVGEARHVSDILVGIGEEDSNRNRNSLSSQLTRYVNDGRYFALEESKGPRHFRVIVENADDGEQNA